MNYDWYLDEYKKKVYLHNKKLSFRMFLASTGAHDHCELCWARFSSHPNDLQNGYYEDDTKSWICPECYNELSSLFGWIADESTN